MNGKYEYKAVNMRFMLHKNFESMHKVDDANLYTFILIFPILKISLKKCLFWIAAFVVNYAT